MGKFNKGLKFVLRIIDIYGSYTWVTPLKGRKGITITNAIQKTLNKSKSKTKKIQIDTGSEFYNSSMKSWPEKNDVEMYSTHNEEKSVFTERFIRILKNKPYKQITSTLKHVYIDNLDDI